MKNRVVTAKVATLQPMSKKPWKSPKGAWIGKVEIVGDIVNLDTSHLWEALRKESNVVSAVE